MSIDKRLAESLAPLITRVRTDVTAVKVPGEGSRWTGQALTTKRLVEHITGERWPRGVCPIRAGENTTRVGLLDLDDHGGDSSWADMAAACEKVCQALTTLGGQPIVWRSSGGHGIHIYLLWELDQDAYSARQWMCEALAMAGFKNGAKGIVHHEIEVFPKQDCVALDGLGNQFILPLAGKSVPLEPLLGYEPLAREDALLVDWKQFSTLVPFVKKPIIERPATPTSTDVLELQTALDAIPNDNGDELDYDDWRNIIFAIHSATGGSAEGLALAHEFSIKSSKYDAAFLDERVWPYIKPREGGITAATIFAKAAEHGWGRPSAVASPDDFEEVPDEKRVAFEEIYHEIAVCSDVHRLLDQMAPKAGAVGIGSVATFNLLSNAIRARFKELTDGPLTAAEAKRAMRPKAEKTQAMASVRRSNTEFGNAERMLDAFGESLMYVPEVSQWYQWTGARWKPVTTEYVLHCAQETIRELPQEIKNCRTDEEREAFFKFCATSQRASMVANMVTLAASNPRVLVPVEHLDSDRNLLGVGNGAVDLRTGQLKAPDPEDRITIVTNVEYDPDAPCPLWLDTLKGIFEDDEEMVAFVQRLLGYSLIGDPKEDILVIPYGVGCNGKSTLLGTVKAVLGGHAKAAASETFLTDGKGGGSAGGAREDVLRLRGSRFVYVTEPDEGSELREGMVKALTGGDVIPARGLWSRNTVEIVPTWVAVMPTNHLPIIKGSDHAIWRRLMPIPFNRNFDKDPDVVKDGGRRMAVLEEAEGILAWLVQGALAYRRGGIQPPAKVKQARNQYRENMDLLNDWLEECCELDLQHVEASSTLWASWHAYAERNGLLGYIRSSKKLGSRLGSRFVADRTDSGARGWRGVRVRDGFEEV